MVAKGVGVTGGEGKAGGGSHAPVALSHAEDNGAVADGAAEPATAKGLAMKSVVSTAEAHAAGQDETIGTTEVSRGAEGIEPQEQGESPEHQPEPQQSEGDAADEEMSLAELVAENESLKAQLETANEVIAERTTEIAKLRDEHQRVAWKLNEDATSSRRSHTREREAFQERCKSLEEELEEMRAKESQGAQLQLETQEKCMSLEAELEELRAKGSQDGGVRRSQDIQLQLETHGMAMAALVLERQKVEGRLVEAVDFTKKLDQALAEANEAITSLRPDVNSEIVAVRQIMQQAFEDASAGATLYAEEVQNLKDEVAEAKREVQAATLAMAQLREYVEQELTDLSDHMLSFQETTRRAKAQETSALTAATEAQDKLTKVQAAADAALEAADAAVEAAKQREAAAREEAAEAKARTSSVANLERELYNVRELCKTLKTKSMVQDDQVRRLQEQVTQGEEATTSVVSKLGPKLEAALNDASVARKEAAKARAQLKATKEAAKGMEVDRDKLLQNIKVIDGEVRALTNTLTREKEATAKVRADLSASVARRRASEQSAAKVQASEKQLRAEALDRKQVLQETRSELEKWKTDANEWRTEATHLQVKMKDFERRKQQEQTKGEVMSYETKEQLKTAEQEASNNKAEAAVMKEMIHTLKAEVRHKEKVEHDLRKKLKQLQHVYEV